MENQTKEHVETDQGEDQEKATFKNEKKGWKAELMNWVQIIAAAAVLAFVLNTFIIANSDVGSGSMETTLMTGSRILGSRLSYQFADPKRGDIAIFVYGWKCPQCHKRVEGERQDTCPFCESEVKEKAETVYYVKRIIGIPGDTIDIVNDKIYLNGSDIPLEEPYIVEKMDQQEIFHFEIPKNSYFMLGDNRNNSTDARYWRNTYIAREKIIAKVFMEYYPQIKIVH